MQTHISVEQFKSELLLLLGETFAEVQGVYLDKGTSLLETLASISAAEASLPVGQRCACIAAQVTHTCVYLEAVDHYMTTGQDQAVDWGEAWRTVQAVTPAEWSALQERLHQAYLRARAAIQAYDRWDAPYSLSGAMGLVTHSAYHLGEIRQATCTIRP